MFSSKKSLSLLAISDLDWCRPNSELGGIYTIAFICSTEKENDRLICMMQVLFHLLCIILRSTLHRVLGNGQERYSVSTSSFSWLNYFLFPFSMCHSKLLEINLPDS